MHQVFIQGDKTVYLEFRVNFIFSVRAAETLLGFFFHVKSMLEFQDHKSLKI